MKIKLYESELKVMEEIWKRGDLSAGELVKILKEKTDWNRNTTYTVIKKCIQKGAIERYEPGFMCRALVEQEEIQQYETKELIDRMFEGSAEKFFAAFIGNQNLSNEEIDSLKKIIENSK